MIPPLPSLQRVATTSPGIARIPQISTLLGAEVLLRPRAAVDAVVGWGRKPNTHGARALAEKRGVPFLALEDGFVAVDSHIAFAMFVRVERTRVDIKIGIEFLYSNRITPRLQ